MVFCHSSKSRRDTTASLHTCIQGSVLRLLQHAAICPALLPTCWLASPRTVLTYNLQFLNRKRLLQVGLSSPSPGPDPGPAESPAWTLCVTHPGPLPGPHSGISPCPASISGQWGVSGAHLCWPFIHVSATVISGPVSLPIVGLTQFLPLQDPRGHPLPAFIF